MKFSGGKKIIVGLMRFLVKPVTAHLALFLLIYTLLNALDIYSSAVNGFNTFFKVFSGIFFAYILVLPVILLRNKAQKVYKVVILVFTVAIFLVDFYLFLMMQRTFATMGNDAVAAIMATNPAEAKEFVNTSFAVDKLIYCVVAVVLLITAFYYLNRVYIKWYILSEFMILVLIALAFNISLGQFYRIKEGNVYYLLTKEKCPDLRDYRQNPDVICSNDSPDNIVLVIGESFTKWHSSLYGYDKHTNPLLGKMAEEDLLHVYRNVKSAFGSTIPVIKSLMSGYLENSGNPTNWYEHLTIIEIMQKAGYETYWISNQSKTGIYENEVGRYADLCDSQSFVGNMHSGTKRSDLDEFLLPLIEESMEKSSNKKFFIIQMQGSHRDYRLRYSPEYAKFGVEDYAATHSRLSLKNREVVARYDNSILYNDYVVTEIMKLFKEKDAVVVYLSDHGQDVFDTSDNFFGHSWENGLDIPMMFYPTPVFCEKHGELVNSIKSNTEKEFRTDSLMYTIMDIAGVETVNGISYKQKSLLK